MCMGHYDEHAWNKMDPQLVINEERQELARVPGWQESRQSGRASTGALMLILTRVADSLCRTWDLGIDWTNCLWGRRV